MLELGQRAFSLFLSYMGIVVCSISFHTYSYFLFFMACFIPTRRGICDGRTWSQGLDTLMPDFSLLMGSF
jgi:hypothetical protein